MINADALYSTKGLTAQQREVRQLALNHFEAFIRLVAPYQELSHAHQDLCKWLESNPDVNKLLLWPRDHGKSRMAAFYAAWQVVRDPAVTIIYASATAEKAEEQLRFIQDILTGKLVQKYFPGLVEESEAKRRGWNKTFCIVDHPKRLYEGVVDSTIMTAGLEKNITGKHCKFLILDDIVVPENNTEEGRKKVNRFASQAASIISNDGTILAVGTRYHPNDAYQIMMDSVIEHEDEEGNIQEEPLFLIQQANVETDGEFLWPRTLAKSGKWFGFNKEILARKRAFYVSNGEIMQFYAQYYNDPNDKSTAPILRDDFQYYQKKDLNYAYGVWEINGRPLRVYAAIDMGASANKKSDYTAIVVGGIDEVGNRYLMECLQFKTDKISEILKNLVNLHNTYKYRKLLIEAVSGFKLVATDLASQLHDAGIRIPVEYYHPNQHTEGGEKSKAARINAILEPLYDAKSIYHYRGGNAQVLEDELCMSNPPHDDLKDAWAMCNSIMEMPVVRRKQKYNNVIQYNPRFGGVAIA